MVALRFLRAVCNAMCSTELVGWPKEALLTLVTMMVFLQAQALLCPACTLARYQLHLVAEVRGHA